MENIKLNNGILMPGIGFGTWKIKDYWYYVKKKDS